MIAAKHKQRLEEIAQWIAITHPITIEVVYHYIPLIKLALEKGATDEQIISLVSAQIKANIATAKAQPPRTLKSKIRHSVLSFFADLKHAFNAMARGN